MMGQNKSNKSLCGYRFPPVSRVDVFLKNGS